MHALLDSALSALPPPARRIATGIGPEFLKFGVVGVLGFLVDTTTVYAARGFVGVYAAGMLAYFTAASINWVINRNWTFRARRGDGPRPGGLRGEWLRYLLVNAAGFVLNRGTFVLLVATVPLCVEHPVLAVAGGAIAGMFVNFGLSRRLVFRPSGG